LIIAMVTAETTEKLFVVADIVTVSTSVILVSFIKSITTDN